MTHQQTALAALEYWQEIHFQRLSYGLVPHNFQTFKALNALQDFMLQGEKRNALIPFLGQIKIIYCWKVQK